MIKNQNDNKSENYINRDIINEMIENNELEGAVLLEGEEFDGGIIGWAESPSGRVLVYSLSRLVESLTRAGYGDEMDAFIWIEYNTMRSLPYMGDRRPIIVMDYELCGA